MGFRLAEATNAWCIRCTRGDRGRCFFFETGALRVVFDFEILDGGVLVLEAGGRARVELQLSVDWRAKVKGRATEEPQAINRTAERTRNRENKTTRNLSPEVATHNRYIVFGQTAHEFDLEVIRIRSDRVSVSFPIGGPALFDVLFQAVVEISVFAPFGDFRLVIKLNLVHQKASKTLRFAMHIRIFLADRGSADRSRRMSSGGWGGYDLCLGRPKSRSCGCGRGVFRSVCRKRITETGGWLHGDSGRSAFRVGHAFAGSLLADRRQLKPRAGRYHQQLDRSRVQTTTGFESAVGIDQRRHLVFQSEREHEDVLVRRAPEVVHEARIHIDDLPAECRSFLKHALWQTTRGIESKFFDCIVVFEPAALPADGGAPLEHEQSSPAAMVRDAVEQCTQNFFLGGARVNGGNSTQKIGGGRACGVRCSRGAQLLWQFLENTAHQFLTQLREMSLQHLGYDTLDNVLDFVLVCHVLAVSLGQHFARQSS